MGAARSCDSPSEFVIKSEKYLPVLKPGSRMICQKEKIKDGDLVAFEEKNELEIAEISIDRDKNQIRLNSPNNGDSVIHPLSLVNNLHKVAWIKF